MSTDRELLELSAKAAGVYLAWNGEFPVQVFERWSGNPEEQPDYDYSDWNPLTDDGDALRLAVRLSLRVYVYSGGGDDCTVAAVNELSGSRMSLSVAHDGDPLAATRRSIVRAAAEIGRAMP